LVKINEKEKKELTKEIILEKYGSKKDEEILKITEKDKRYIEEKIVSIQLNLLNK
jgi:hypothetical protein